MEDGNFCNKISTGPFKHPLPFAKDSLKSQSKKWEKDG